MLTQSVSAAGTPSSPSRRQSVRNRRLLADSQSLCTALAESDIYEILHTTGDPVDTYQIQFHVAGLIKPKRGEPEVSYDHIAEIKLTSDYPRLSPKCKMLTPIFHPNIEPSMICVGDHWAASEQLLDLVVRICQIITYQAYNLQSPLDGEAAMWADLNQNRLPIDTRDLYPAE